MTTLNLYLVRYVPTNLPNHMAAMTERVVLNVEDAQLSSLLAQGYSLAEANVVSYTSPVTTGYVILSTP